MAILIGSNEVARAVAFDLLKIKALILRPNDYFTWASGIKSPVYCDNRLILSYPEVRTHIIDAFVKLIKEHYPDTNCIAGVATSGIPHAALIADKMNLPMVYVRAKAKEHGRGNLVEGKIFEGAKILLIEDLFSTGKSSIEAGVSLRSTCQELSATLLGIVSVFSYALSKLENNMSAESFKFLSLTTFDHVADEALHQNAITPDQYQELLNWRVSIDV